ncbi:hypothetical protein HA050_19140 [Iodobacter sp. HSC-16F04]|uniref:Uncharacterized protein n=1 Tax=Iodobacter violaceini TaxID=3044271 RepID=A0ABX0KWP3_9NEIS|nr:hypothetical protein [Iodobacter violacea]NHQ88224.1 hypothetical protein [Iodobacter violacea]
MRYLISKKYTIYFEVNVGDEEIEIAAYAKGIQGGDVKKIANSESAGFYDVYNKIGLFLDKGREEYAGNSYFKVALAHVQQYKDNLYGFSIFEGSVFNLEKLLFIQEAYVQFFSLEIASFFYELNESDWAMFYQELTVCSDSKNEHYSEVIELERLVQCWKRISS